jgi:hypothetical protein
MTECEHNWIGLDSLCWCTKCGISEADLKPELEYQWAPLHEQPAEGWTFADHLPKGAPDPQQMIGHRLWMREIKPRNMVIR